MRFVVSGKRCAKVLCLTGPICNSGGDSARKCCFNRGMQVAFAYLVLFSWPVVVIVMFRRLSLSMALVWSVLGAYLFLPRSYGFNLPVLPSVDKAFIGSVPAAMMCYVTVQEQRYKQIRNGLRPARGSGARRRIGTVWANILVLLILILPIMTVLTNREPLFYGSRVLAGLRPYDIGSMMLISIMTLIPFVLGRQFLNTPQAHRDILIALVTGGLLYSLLILIEIRMSPQLERWIYGLYQSRFAQHVRYGGYRPMVFLSHGLIVGIFVAMSFLSAIAMLRVARRRRRKGSQRVVTSNVVSRQRRSLADMSVARWLLVALWLFVILVLCKTVGALFLAVLFLPVALFAGPRLQLLFALCLAAIILVYPMLRGSGLVPAARITESIAAVDRVRASSLSFRFRNEDILLAHANRKPLFGWGGWGRSRVYDERTGTDLSTTDGAWVIEMGTSGWMGYVSKYGLLTLPCFLLFTRRKKIGLELESAGLTMVLLCNLTDMIPNASLSPITWLVAGALVGRAETPLPTASIPDRQPDSDADAPPEQPRNPYSRHPVIRRRA